MTAEIVTEQTILTELHRVPHDRWDDVLAFLRSLRQDALSAGDNKRPLRAADLLHSEVMGMWAERSDIGESREFARRLREQAQTRRGD